MYYEGELMHVGVAHDANPPGRGSGRFGYGTGENPGQRDFTFTSQVNKYRDAGLKDGEIAKILLGPYATSNNLRAKLSIESSEQRKLNIEKAMELYQKTGNKSEVARMMGVRESVVRYWLDPAVKDQNTKYENTANAIKEVIKRHANDDSKGMIDVSKSTELYLGVTDNTKKVALAMLQEEGYLVTTTKIPAGNHEIKINVVAPPGTTWSDVQKNKFNIAPIDTFSPDKGKEWFVPEPPQSIDSKRIFIRYGDEGGKAKDGTIELRKGVDDLNLGNSQYAQVRIAVDGTHYMKGMAIYSDDVPEGYDIIYNTNKVHGTPMINGDKGVLKPMKVNESTGEIDQNNPFGALIKGPKNIDGVLTGAGQSHYIDKNGKTQLSAINKIREEGEWETWSKTLSAQFLSKQPLKLINQQIDLSVSQKKLELEEINSLTNKVIKKKLLEDYAAECDRAAADLAVKGFKNQAYQVLLPLTTIKDDEVYAPNYKPGDLVALVRYPHAGTFEIPLLKVNNNLEEGKTVVGNSKDAIGINTKVAQQLSGADFDGDFVAVIPVASNNLGLKATKPLSGLENFDPDIYTLPDSAPKIKNRTLQLEMGKVSNLITDMTIGGATNNDIIRAVKHSMVVIDSKKHHYDYKKSFEDNSISQLKKDYQGRADAGASTIISRAGAGKKIPERREITDTYKMTPEELEVWNRGDRVFRDTGRLIKKKITNPEEMTEDELKLYNAGKKVYRTTNKLALTEVNGMDTVSDARDLVRDKTNLKEMAYARYANELKDMARQARRASRSITPDKVNQEAKREYASEIADLESQLRNAQKNNPRERTAQTMMNLKFNEVCESNPGMDYEHKQREKARILNECRAAVGAHREEIQISDRQWEAIQSNAITHNKVREILLNTDQDKFKQRAMPKKNSNELATAQQAYLRSMLASGMFTNSEIADRLGVSVSTVVNYK